MAIPKSKYSEPKHTPGREFTLDGKDYRGWYVQTFDNRYYTGNSITTSSKELKLFTPPAVKQDIFIQEVSLPSVEERNNGVFKRYIVQRINNRKIIEVSKEKYDLFINKSPYRTAVVPWIIKGPAENSLYNGYTYYGAQHKNRETVKSFENKIPGIVNFFKNYSEFVE